MTTQTHSGTTAGSESFEAMHPDVDVPAGYRPLPPMSGFMAAFGKLYQHETTRAFGMRVKPNHVNPLGVAHGGMLATIADSLIGIAMLQSAGRSRPGVTVHLSVDYLRPARPGDWLEVHIDLDRMGQRLRVGGCRLMVGDRCVMKASATFAVVEPVVANARD